MTRLAERRNCTDKRKYGAGVRSDGRVFAWRESEYGTATTLPRVIHDARLPVPYSCEGGSVGSWLLWFDVLADLTGDCTVAGRWAGVLEPDMSYALRDHGQVVLGAEHLLSWIALVTYVERRGRL